jgi:hypothetical protein
MVGLFDFVCSRLALRKGTSVMIVARRAVRVDKGNLAYADST